MPRRSKGARLWLQPPRRDKQGNITERSVWVIRDGPFKRSTGCSESAREEAERRLAAYIAEKHRPERTKEQEPNEIFVSDVLSVYLDDIVPGHTRPSETAARIDRLLSFFGRLRLSDINGKSCREYSTSRRSKSSARRELEDLRAAINHYRKEGFCSRSPKVTLPPRPLCRTRWLTRDEAAKLLLAAWRMRQSYKGGETKRATGHHLARFILIALYTGTRASLVCGAAIRPTVGKGYVDLDAGLLYRKPPGSSQNKKNAPTIPLPSRLVAHMKRWEHRGISRQFVVEWNGKPVRRVSKSFKTACIAAGLSNDVTPHVLRHTAATWLMQKGVDAWEAGGYLGMSVETLERTYGHHHPNHLAAAREAITRHNPDRYTRTEDERLFPNSTKKHKIAKGNK